MSEENLESVNSLLTTLRWKYKYLTYHDNKKCTSLIVVSGINLCSFVLT